jgi:hypothetical protein
MIHQSKRFSRLIAASTALMFTVGCASATIIRSEPGEANLYIDGSKVGTTPYTHSDTKIVGSLTTLRLTKEGYKDFETFIKRDEEVQVGPVVGGFFFWPVWLWAMGYKPERNYELTPLKQPQQSEPEAPPAAPDNS